VLESENRVEVRGMSTTSWLTEVEDLMISRFDMGQLWTAMEALAGDLPLPAPRQRAAIDVAVD